MGLAVVVKNFGHNAVQKQNATRNLQELNYALFCWSLVLNFQSIPLHRSAVNGYHGNTPLALVCVLHHSEILVKMLTVFIIYGTTGNRKGIQV
jgi:hypothetical protein